MTVRNLAGGVARRLARVFLAVAIPLAACSSPSRAPDHTRSAVTPYPVLKELCQSPQPLTQSQANRLYASNRGHACTNAILIGLQSNEDPGLIQRFHELSCSQSTPRDQFSCQAHLLLPDGRNRDFLTGKVPAAWITKIADEALARCIGEWTSIGDNPADREQTCNTVVRYYEARNDKANIGKAYASFCYRGGTPTRNSDAAGGTYAPDYSYCEKAEQLGVKIDRKRAQEAAALRASDATTEAQETARQQEEDRQREIEEAEERQRQREDDRLERQQMMGAIVAGLSSVAQSMPRNTGRYGTMYTPMSAGQSRSDVATRNTDMRAAQCAAITTQCAAPTSECKGGTMNACYRAAACTCQAAINLGGCGQDVAGLRQCVVKNLSMVEALKTPPQAQQRQPSAPATAPQPAKQKDCNRYWGDC